MTIRLDNYCWICHCHIQGHDSADEIIRELSDIGCDGGFLSSAAGMLESDKPDIGFCYSNTRLMESVIYIGKSSSPKQFLNTIFHEFYHLAVHIADKYSISKDGEEFCYLIGDIGENASMFILFEIHKLICNH